MVIDINNYLNFMQTQAVGSQENVTKKDISSFDVEQLVLGYIKDIDAAKVNLRQEKSMLKDMIEGDAEYSKLKAVVDEAKKKLNARKSQLLLDKSAVALMDKIDGIKEELKESQLTLAQYAEKYVEQTGLFTIEDSNGEVNRIVKSFKVVKK